MMSHLIFDNFQEKINIIFLWSTFIYKNLKNLTCVVNHQTKHEEKKVSRTYIHTTHIWYSVHNISKWVYHNIWILLKAFHFQFVPRSKWRWYFIHFSSWLSATQPPSIQTQLINSSSSIHTHLANELNAWKEIEWFLGRKGELVKLHPLLMLFVYYWYYYCIAIKHTNSN